MLNPRYRVSGRPCFAGQPQPTPPQGIAQQECLLCLVPTVRWASAPSPCLHLCCASSTQHMLVMTFNVWNLLAFLHAKETHIQAL